MKGRGRQRGIPLPGVRPDHESCIAAGTAGYDSCSRHSPVRRARRRFRTTANLDVRHNAPPGPIRNTHGGTNVTDDRRLSTRTSNGAGGNYQDLRSTGGM